MGTYSDSKDYMVLKVTVNNRCKACLGASDVPSAWIAVVEGLTDSVTGYI